MFEDGNGKLTEEEWRARLPGDIRGLLAMRDREADYRDIVGLATLVGGALSTLLGALLVVTEITDFWVWRENKEPSLLAWSGIFVIEFGVLGAALVSRARKRGEMPFIEWPSSVFWSLFVPLVTFSLVTILAVAVAVKSLWEYSLEPVVILGMGLDYREATLAWLLTFGWLLHETRFVFFPEVARLGWAVLATFLVFAATGEWLGEFISDFFYNYSDNFAYHFALLLCFGIYQVVFSLMTRWRRPWRQRDREAGL